MTLSVKHYAPSQVIRWYTYRDVWNLLNASTIFWAQGLSAPPGHMPPISHHGPDERVQKLTANVLAKFLG